MSVALFLASFLPVLKGLLTPDGRRTVSGLLYYLIIPAFLFDVLSRAITAAHLIQWWPLCLNMTISLYLGLGLGWLQNWLLNTPEYFRGHVLYASAVGNTGNLPLVLVDALMKEASGPGGSSLPSDGLELGVAYVAMGNLVITFQQFSLANYLMNRPQPAAPEQQETNGTAQQQQNGHSQQNGSAQHDDSGQRTAGSGAGGEVLQAASSEAAGRYDAEEEHVGQPAGLHDVELVVRPALHHTSHHGASYASIPTKDDPDERDSFTERRGLLHSAGSTAGRLSRPRGLSRLHSWRDVRERVAVSAADWWPHLRTRLTQLHHFIYYWLVNPPSVGALVALVVGSIPQLKAAVYTTGSPFATLADIIHMLGDCCIPLVVLLLGATLEQGPGKGTLPLRTLLGLGIARLVVLPLLGLGLVLAAVALNLINMPDPMFLFVLMLQHTTPSALMLHTMSTLYRRCELEASTVLFWQYLATLLVMPAFLMLFLWIGQQYFPPR